MAYHQRLQSLGVRCDLHTEPAASHNLVDKSLYVERVLPVIAEFFLDAL